MANKVHVSRHSRGIIVNPAPDIKERIKAMKAGKFANIREPEGEKLFNRYIEMRDDLAMMESDGSDSTEEQVEQAREAVNRIKKEVQKAGLPTDRYHDSGDGWGRGSYTIPALAVLGSSDTGSYSDSPAPTKDVAGELETFSKLLTHEGIPNKELSPSLDTGNVFMAKRWIGVLHPKDWKRAIAIAKTYVKMPGVRYAHGALG